MATLTGTELAEGIRDKMEELKKVCTWVDEGIAACAPQGRWSPKEILSHLCGPEGTGRLPLLQALCDGDTPFIDLNKGNPFFSENRARMSFSQIFAEVEAEYDRIAVFATALTLEQLDRTARISKLKESPSGEYPTVQSMISGLGEYHLQFHIDQMREVLQLLQGDYSPDCDGYTYYLGR